MSDRSSTPVDQTLAAWRQATDAAILKLQQRPIGGGNGLILPGGGAGSWQALALAGTWAQLDAGTHAAQWAMDVDGFVHLRGLIQHPASWPTGAVATLPAANARDEYFNQPVYNGTATGSVILQTTGTSLLLPVASPLSWGSTGWVGLSGISYYAGSQ
jgi:hypothetical protein